MKYNLENLKDLKDLTLEERAQTIAEFLKFRLPSYHQLEITPIYDQIFPESQSYNVRGYKIVKKKCSGKQEDILYCTLDPSSLETSSAKIDVYPIRDNKATSHAIDALIEATERIGVRNLIRTNEEYAKEIRNRKKERRKKAKLSGVVLFHRFSFG